jgi:hypothetical protein
MTELSQEFAHSTNILSTSAGISPRRTTLGQSSIGGFNSSSLSKRTTSKSLQIRVPMPHWVRVHATRGWHSLHEHVRPRYSPSGLQRKMSAPKLLLCPLPFNRRPAAAREFISTSVSIVTSRSASFGFGLSVPSEPIRAIRRTPVTSDAHETKRLTSERRNDLSISGDNVSMRPNDRAQLRTNREAGWPSAAAPC